MGNKLRRWEGKLEWANHCLDLTGRTLVMGILNVTPDSFSDGGKFFEKNKAIEQGIKLFEDGADIIDIGGESTRPGAKYVNPQEQINRVVPVIAELSKHISVPISIDTQSAEVAKAALDIGASIINDISALRFDEQLAELAAERDVPVILMHMQGNPKTMQINPYYDDIIREIKNFLSNRIKFAVQSGIDKNKIIIDVGIGFGKRLADNYALIDKIDEFYELGIAVLVGHSRKSFITKTLHTESISERDNVTLAISSLLAYKKVHILRVHDVKATRLACDMIYRLTKEARLAK